VLLVVARSGDTSASHLQQPVQDQNIGKWEVRGSVTSYDHTLNSGVTLQSAEPVRRASRNALQCTVISVQLFNPFHVGTYLNKLGSVVYAERNNYGAFPKI
jgi:hypothetical protein